MEKYISDDQLLSSLPSEGLHEKYSWKSYRLTLALYFTQVWIKLLEICFTEQLWRFDWKKDHLKCEDAAALNKD